MAKFSVAPAFGFLAASADVRVPKNDHPIRLLVLGLVPKPIVGASSGCHYPAVRR